GYRCIVREQPEKCRVNVSVRTVRNPRSKVLEVRLEAGLVCVTCGLAQFEVSTDTPTCPRQVG
ncbi:MAG: hypothetical protein P5694_18210, partial [Limnospira sp. PMC 1286.21]|nr:hypothetical protein [Limnospira sp. PMC 1238.20]MDT9194804.1 hypothetical protein [Limnospira sp. PMC 1245.20]MDT9205121.1 hypothetical protein [Limnospira sp. PMC 1243.20]MDT9210228.1 hypothetical protein [Limnospira sp. PMC 1252.20]MDT9256151.1 hypothetical protein [Limnospira sp. PMC 1254.20]MDT9271413.1 hypothetical protein [Limnospira sp. PMC 1234.20]MDT9281705.1 hypothetical protein [Limnospira sp. PMC 1293.21]MDT9291866.1 hypothetical protein [Limnospira sp. PMC 1295.21]MDT931752